MIRLNLQLFGKGSGSGIGGYRPSGSGSKQNISQGEKKEHVIDYTTPVTKLERGGVYDVKQIKGSVTRDYSGGETYEDLKELLRSYSYNKNTKTWTSKTRKDVSYIVTRHKPRR